MSIRKYLNESNFFSAFWITPQGKVIDCGAQKHIDFVCKEPRKFGMTEQEIQAVYDKHNEPYGFEGVAREEILLSVIRKGFIRIRKYRDMWSINVVNWNHRTSKLLSDWAYEMLKGSNKERYMPIKISSDTGTPPKNLDMEGLSNLSESHEPIQLITLNEMEYLVEVDKPISRWYNEEEKMKPIEESSLARIWQHVQEEDRSFGVISAYMSSNSEKENVKRHAELRSKVRKYGYIELKGGYKYEEDDEYTLEKSYLVPNIPKEELLKLCKEFNQESVLYKDSKEFVLIKQDGSVDMKFTKSGGKENFQQAQDAVKYFFSSLLKGAHRGRKFAFKLLECEGINNHIQCYALKVGKPLCWYNIIED